MFEQEVEDIGEWISDMEKQLASQDLGKDLISVNNLIKDHNVSSAHVYATSIDTRECIYVLCFTIDN